jgi:O-antigen/teichoic acid export membrane protein
VRAPGADGKPPDVRALSKVLKMGDGPGPGWWQIHPLFKRIGWRLSLDLISRGSFLLLNILIARRLGVEDFGRFSYALYLALMLQIGTELGSSLFMIKELGSAAPERRLEMWTDFAELKAVLSLGVLLLGLAFSPLLWRWPHPWIFWCALLSMIGNSFYDFLQFVCNGLGRLDLARTHMLLQRGGLFLAVVAALIWTPTLSGILPAMGLASVGMAAISVAFFYRALGRAFRWNLRLAEWGRILRHSYSLGIAGFLASSYLRLGVVLLTWLAGPLVTGYYNAGFRIFEFSYILPAAIMVMAVPHLAAVRARESRPALRREVRRLSWIMAGLGLLCAAFLGLGAPLLVRMIYGQAYGGAVPVLRVLGLCGIMVFINYFVTHLMVVFDLQKIHARNELLAFVWAAAAYLLLSRLRPGTGTAAALLSTEVLLFFLTLASLRRGWARMRTEVPDGAHRP